MWKWNWSHAWSERAAMLLRPDRCPLCTWGWARGCPLWPARSWPTVAETRDQRRCAEELRLSELSDWACWAVYDRARHNCGIDFVRTIIAVCVRLHMVERATRFMIECIRSMWLMRVRTKQLSISLMDWTTVLNGTDIELQTVCQHEKRVGLHCRSWSRTAVPWSSARRCDATGRIGMDVKTE